MTTTTSRTSCRLLLSTLGIALSIVAVHSPASAGGLYLRGGIGVGGAALDRQVSGSAGGITVDAGDSRVEGGVGALQVAIGGFASERVAVAATLLVGSMGEAALEGDDGGEVELPDGLGFALLGVTVDVYQRARGSGLRGGVGLGLAGAWARLPEPSLFEGIGGAGLGVTLELGYAFAVSPRWNLDVGAQLLAAGLRGDDEELGIEASEKDGFGALLVTVSGSYRGR